MAVFELVGWIGGVCFALCAVPQAVKAWRSRSTDDLSWGFLGMWLVGEICMLAYVIPTGNAPLLFNYAGNLVCLLVIIYVKVRQP